MKISNRVAVLLLILLVSCKSSNAEAPKTAPAKPSKLEPLERVRVLHDAGSGPVGDSKFEIAPFEARGPAMPEEVVDVFLSGESAKTKAGPLDVVSLAGRRVLLHADAETYLAQILPLLVALDDGHSIVFLTDADAKFAFALTLRDEAAFQVWIDEATPGKLRIIQRADGFELQTNMGKLPGADPNGPSVPNRGGLDLPTLQKGLLQIKGRFLAAPDVCWVPTFGTYVNDVFRSMQANYVTPEKYVFENLCLVYPRPAAQAVDAGR